MGIIASSGVGSFERKIGNIVTYLSRRKNVVRVYRMGKRNPRTGSQQLVRARFSVLGRLALDFVDAVDLGYSRRAKLRETNAANVFMKANWEAVSVTSPTDISVNYADLKVADGSQRMVSFGVADWGEHDHLHISVPFEGNVGGTYSDGSDTVYLFAYVPELEFGLLSGGATRSSDAAVLVAPASWTGMTAHLYGFTVSKNGDNVSKSTYIGRGEVQ